MFELINILSDLIVRWMPCRRHVCWCL